MKRKGICIIQLGERRLESSWPMFATDTTARKTNRWQFRYSMLYLTALHSTHLLFSITMCPYLGQKRNTIAKRSSLVLNSNSHRKSWKHIFVTAIYLSDIFSYDAGNKYSWHKTLCQFVEISEVLNVIPEIDS